IVFLMILASYSNNAAPSGAFVADRSRDGDGQDPRMGQAKQLARGMRREGEAIQPRDAFDFNLEAKKADDRPLPMDADMALPANRPAALPGVPAPAGLDDARLGAGAMPVPGAAGMQKGAGAGPARGFAPPPGPKMEKPREQSADPKAPQKAPAMALAMQPQIKQADGIRAGKPGDNAKPLFKNGEEKDLKPNEQLVRREPEAEAGKAMKKEAAGFGLQ